MTEAPGRPHQRSVPVVTVRCLMNEQIRERLTQMLRVSNGTGITFVIEEPRQIMIERERLDLVATTDERRWTEEITISQRACPRQPTSET